MNNCILMTAYKDASLINRIISKIPESWDIYIHVDNRSSIKVEQIDKRAKTIKKRKIFWGSFEHPMAFLDLMNLAYEHKKYDYYHLITGQDYPCKNLNSMNQILGGGGIYMYSNLLPDSTWVKFHCGYDIVKNITIARFSDVHKMGVPKIINKGLQVIQTIKPRFLWLINPSVYKLARGSVYCSLPNYAVDFILQSPLTKFMCKKMKNSMVGEEIFFQSILENSPYKNRIIHKSLRFVKWDGGRSPKLLNEGDYDEITQSDCFFCRKVDSIVSAKLLEKIDSELLNGN